MSIAQSLKVKAKEAEVLKTELEGTQTAFIAYKEARKVEDRRLKELVDDIKMKQIHYRVRPVNREGENQLP